MKKLKLMMLLGVVVLTISLSMSFVFAGSSVQQKGTIDTKNNISEMESLIKNTLRETQVTATVSSKSKWVPLYSLSGIKYAYFVPLNDKNSKSLCGYSVVSSVNDKNRELVSAVGPDTANYATMILKFLSSKKGELIYEFPESFFIKKGKTYYHIDGSGTLTKIKNIKIYEKNGVVKYLSKEPPSVSAFDTATYGQLAHWSQGQFVPIVNAGITYYGGYQDWLTDEGVSQPWANRSCGVTAASNMMHYLSKYKSGKAKLYTRTGITRREFSKYQKDVYGYVNPTIIGIPSLNNMASKVKSFASARGVSLAGVRSSASWNETNVRDYVSTGLKSECPVLLLTYNSKIPELKYHWVTVTRLYNDGSSTKMITSNWSSQVTYDFSTWANMGSAYRAVIYFK